MSALMQIWFSNDASITGWNFKGCSTKPPWEIVLLHYSKACVYIYKKNGSFFFFAFKWMIIAIGIFHFYNVQGGYCVNLAQSIICYAVTDAFCHWDNMLKRRFSTLRISYSLHCLYFAKAQLLSKNVTFLSLQLLSLSLQLPVTNLGNCVT